MTKRPSHRTGRRAGLLRAAAIAAITLTALAAGPFVQRASAQGALEIPVTQINSEDTTLPEVAQLTLGNPNLADEIFQLNDDRPQHVGGVLTSPDQQLEVGWILELPQGASGSLVYDIQVSATPGPSAEFVESGGSGNSSSTGSGNSGSTGSTGSGNSGTASHNTNSHSSSSHGTTTGQQSGIAGAKHAVTMLGLKLPVFLAVIGGLLLIVLTLVILRRRRRTARGTRKGLAAWLAGPFRQRRERRSRAALGRAWRADSDSPGLAGTALAEAGRAIPPAVQAAIVADMRPDAVRVFPVPDLVPPQPWQADPEAPGTWVRPRFPGYIQQVSDAMSRPVRVGGDQDRQLFVDVSHCDGAIALTGDPGAASEALLALLGEFGAHHPDLVLAVLGEARLGSVKANLMRNSSQLAALVGPEAPAIDSPVRAAAVRRRITGVVAVSGDAPIQERAEVVRLCSQRGSTWLAVVVGDVPGAHWRWDVDHDGHVRLSSLGQTVLAPL